MPIPTENLIVVVNPLPTTLAHYEAELIDTLSRVGKSRIEVIAERGDGQLGNIAKLKSAFKILTDRFRMSFRYLGNSVIVIWPLFGYLDIVTWILVARRNSVYIVVHDPVPLRPQIGYSATAKWIFSRLARQSRIVTICHTQLAAGFLSNETSVVPMIASHPIIESAQEPRNRNRAGAIRVLGQYKEARTLDPLIEIGKGRGTDELVFEIYGRNWPDLDRWKVTGEFLPEDEFDRLIKTSRCIVIPYARFFQSGVAVRALEAGVPVVAPRHEHIEELYGRDWPGIVGDGEDWSQALHRVLNLDEFNLADRQKHTVNAVDSGWLRLVECQRRGVWKHG